jgi:hypothetical protein
VTFAAVGSAISSTTSSVSLDPQNVGDLILLAVGNHDNNTVYATGVSGGGATWTQMGSPVLGVNNNRTMVLFAGQVTATGSGTATVTWSGATPSATRIAGQEFSSTVGSWTLDVQGSLDLASGTNTWASLTPAAAGELYFGWGLDTSGAVAGSTSGYTYDVVSGNGMAFNADCSASAQAPVWGDSGMVFGLMALVREGTARGPARPPAYPRRTLERAVWRAVTGQAYVAVPAPRQQPYPAHRRPLARAVVRGIAVPGIRGTAPGQQYRTPPRRTLGRAFIQFTPVRTVNAIPPAGSVQPRATIPVPRRTLGRAFIQFTPVRTVNAIPPAGSVQPRATIPVPRRTIARGAWRGITGRAFTPGTVQPRPTIPLPRRQLARAVVRGIAVPGIRGTAPRQQYRTPPRRTLARGLWRAVTGQAHVAVPAPRQQYRTHPRRQLARAYVQFTPVRTVNGQRPLIISLASAAGTDDYGNTFPQGIQVGPGNGTAQVQILPGLASGIAQVIFPMPAAGLSNTPNTAAGLSGGGVPTLEISGPASGTAGDGDWVQFVLWANDGIGDTARAEFRYIDTSGGVHVIASYTSGAWTFDAAVSLGSSATATDLTISSQMFSPNGNPVFGWSEDGAYPLSTSVPDDSNSGTTWVSGERAFMNDNWVAAINNTAGLVNYIYAVLQDAGIIAGG